VVKLKALYDVFGYVSNKLDNLMHDHVPWRGVIIATSRSHLYNKQVLIFFEAGQMAKL